MVPDNNNTVDFDPPANYSVSKKDDIPAAITGLLLSLALYFQYKISGSFNPLNVLIIAVLMLIRLRAKDFWIRYDHNVWMIKRPMKKPVVFLNRDITGIDIQKTALGKLLIISWNRNEVDRSLSLRFLPFDIIPLLNDFQNLYPDKITERVRQEIARRTAAVNQSFDLLTTVFSTAYALYFLYAASQVYAKSYAFDLFHSIVLFAPVVMPFTLVATLFFRYGKVRWARTKEAWATLITGIAVFILFQHLGTRFLQVSAYGEFFAGLIILSILCAALALRSALATGYSGTAAFLLVSALIPMLVREKINDGSYLQAVQDFKSDGKYVSRWGQNDDYYWVVEKSSDICKGRIFDPSGSIVSEVELPGSTTLGFMEFNAYSYITNIDRDRWLVGNQKEVSIFYSDTTLISQILWQKDKPSITHTPLISPSNNYLTWSTGYALYVASLERISQAQVINDSDHSTNLGFNSKDELIYAQKNHPEKSNYRYSIYKYDFNSNASTLVHQTHTSFLTSSMKQDRFYLWGINSDDYWVCFQLENGIEEKIVSSHQIDGFTKLRPEHLSDDKTILVFENNSLNQRKESGIISALWQNHHLTWLPDTLSGKLLDIAGDTTACSILLHNESLFDIRRIHFAEDSDSLNSKMWRTPSILSALSGRRFNREISAFSENGKEIFWPYDWQKLITQDGTMKLWRYSEAADSIIAIK